MTTTSISRTSSTKNLPAIYQRKTKNHINALSCALYQVVSEQQPMTVRQVFYQMVSRGYIAKSEKEYRQTVCRLLRIMRLKGEMPFNWIVDNTRYMRKPTSFGSVADMLNENYRNYRRDIWQDQPDYVEIWIEKDALAGIISDVTYQYDVPLMVTRGFSSLSYIYQASETMRRVGKPIFIYYLGDYDPAGVSISETIPKQFYQIAPDLKIHFERIAVTEQQILEYQLPVRPTKQTDARSRGFSDYSVELDAFSPDRLKSLVYQAISWHLDDDSLKETIRAQQEDQDIIFETMHHLVEVYPDKYTIS